MSTRTVCGHLYILVEGEGELSYLLPPVMSHKKNLPPMPLYTIEKFKAVYKLQKGMTFIPGSTKS